MENLDPNQLPMLPDPSEDEASLPATLSTPSLPMVSKTTVPWLKTKIARVSFITLGAIAVVLIVLFSAQIGQLLNLFGTKASTNQSVILDQDTFLDPGHVMTPADSFKVEAGRLMLNPPIVIP